MTTSRFLTGAIVLALVPMALASTPVEAQVSSYADGAVSIDLGALPGGGYGPTIAVTGEEGAAPYTGALRVPGPNRPRSQLFVAPEKSAPLRKLKVTRAEPKPAPRPRSTVSTEPTRPY